MRPNNSNKRLRGRNRSKNTNPLARSYESNGPDVKIRGSAVQVADKYAQLARDAQSSGDRVMAENYLQHAEHYYRIVAAAYEQTNQQQQQPRERRDDNDQPRNGRGDDRNFGGGEQPTINGFDGLEEDDEGVRRALHANGNGAHGPNGAAHDAPEEAEEATAEVNGAAVSVEPSDEGVAEVSADAAAGEAADPPAEEAPRPRRRTRTTRRPRTRRTAEPEEETGAAEASE